MSETIEVHFEGDPTATRAKDILKLNDTLYGENMSYIFKYSPLSIGVNTNILTLSQTYSIDNFYRIDNLDNVATMRKKIVGNVPVSFARTSNTVVGETISAGFAIGNGSAYGCWNGGAVSVDTSTGDNLTRLSNNEISSTGNILLKNFKYYSEKLTTEQLQALTL